MPTENHAAILDERSRAALEHVIELTERHGTIRHDLSDPHDAAYLDWLARGSGMTPERYPNLFEMIAHRPDAGPVDRTLTFEDPQGDPETAFVPNQIVDYLGIVERGTYANRGKGHGTLTRIKEIESVTVWLMIVNYAPEKTTVIASGHEGGFGIQTVRVETLDEAAIPFPTGGKNSGLISWQIRYTDKTTESATQPNPWASQTAKDPKVEVPEQNPERVAKKIGDLSSIVMGLSRGYNNPGKNSDIDYWFWRNQWEKIELLVPLTGSMEFEHPLAPLNASNPILEFYLARQEGGMSKHPIGEASKYRQKFSIDTTNNKNLKFSLEATETEEGTALNFGKSEWVADTRTFFTCRVTVAFQNAEFGMGTATIMSSETEDQDPTDGVTYIKPLVYVWHCLVAGTQITMADGSTKAVETLDSQDVVRSGGGTQRAVLATLAQPHWGTVYVIGFASGKSLTCSGTHPIVTNAGPVAAARLTAGTVVVTEGGSDTVSTVTTQQQEGQGLFNLWLDPTAAGATTMLANGIFVGDYQMQVALVEAGWKDPELVREKLSKDVLRDYESYLEDTAATNA